jgi:hypothetical protein
MKSKLLVSLIIATTLILGMMSCKKEVVEPTTQEEEVVVVEEFKTYKITHDRASSVDGASWMDTLYTDSSYPIDTITADSYDVQLRVGENITMVFIDAYFLPSNDTTTIPTIIIEGVEPSELTESIFTQEHLVFSGLKLKSTLSFTRVK